MKKNVSIILLVALLLFPFSFCKATPSLDEEWPGYHCYLLSGDSRASFYQPVFTYREYGANNVNEADSSSTPNPQCLDGSYQQRYPLINDGSCEINLYVLHTPCEGNSNDGLCCGGHCDVSGAYSYSGWKATPTAQNQYSQYPKDCAASAAIASQLSSTPVNEWMFIEAGKNSDFYDQDEMNLIKNYDSSFNDDTNFCFIRKYGNSDEDIMFYFGHPYKVFYYYDDDSMMAMGFSASGSDYYYLDFDEAEYHDVIPSLSTIEKSDLTSLDTYNFQPGESKIVLNNGQLITTQSDCLETTRDWLDQTYNQQGYDIDLNYYQNMQSTVATIEDPNRITDTNDFGKLISTGYTANRAIDMCTYSSSSSQDISDGKYHCYKYTHAETIRKPAYNTTVWTDKTLSCRFELMEDWDIDDCKNASLNHTSRQCVSSTNSHEPCYKITNSGYNGVADFYLKGSKTSTELQCYNYRSLHFVYVLIIIMAPIITILFVTFDLIRSIMSGDPKKVATFRSKLIRRLIALLILVMLPIIVSILVNTLSKNDKIKDTSALKYVIIGCD